jgi:hypothetical protein
VTEQQRENETMQEDGNEEPMTNEQEDDEQEDGNEEPMTNDAAVELKSSRGAS